MIRLATDIGGTFTDLIGHDELEDQSRGVLDAISAAETAQGMSPLDVTFFVYGGTTVINAITERTGVRTALLTTRIFETF
jgi:N-methylhydantoinase A